MMDKQKLVKTNIVTGQVDNLSPITVAALGPSGTCSEHISNAYIKNLNCEGTVNLYETFEDAIFATQSGKADCVIIPSAYRKLADIIFQRDEHLLEITDVFIMKTLNLVIATNQELAGSIKVATHSSPSRLVQKIFPDAELVMAKSNSDAAERLSKCEVNACLTTLKCAEMHKFAILHDFGSFNMGWNVIKKRTERSN